MPKGDTHSKKHNKSKIVNYNSNSLKIPNENEGENIGEVVATLGGCRFTIKLVNDNTEIQALASRSFSHGPRKEIIKTKDYVIIQPGISKNQYFINHKYTELEVQKLYDLNHIGKPKKSVTIDESDIVDNIVEESQEDFNIDDIWNI